MSSNAPPYCDRFSWGWAAAGVLVGVGAGYVLGVATSRWLLPAPGAQDERRRVMEAPSASNLVAALVELTAEVARLRQALHVGSLLPSSSGGQRLWRGASSADFVSAQGDNPESEDDFYEPNDTEVGEEITLVVPNWEELDELGKRTQESHEACVTLSEQIKTALVEHPESVGLFWRLSRVLFHLSTHLEQNGDTEGQKKVAKEAMEFAQQALDLDSNVWQSHQWYAISCGSLAKFEGIQKKIEMGFHCKEHIEQAVSLSPTEPTLHHLQGRFRFEVAGISWLERKAAAALFGSTPESSYEEALESFMKAEELNPHQWKSNALMVAKCHIKLSDLPMAVEWLRKAHSMPTISPEDHSSQREVEELLTKHDPSFTIV